MRPVRSLATGAALVVVLAGCGGSAAGDPRATLRDALEDFTPPEQGTVAITFEGDLAALAEGGALAGGLPGDPDADAAAVALLEGLELRATTVDEQVGLAVDLDGSTVLDVRSTAPDELYVRIALEQGLDALAALSPEGEDDQAGEIDGLLELLGGEAGPLAPLLSGDWVRLTGLEEAGDGLGMALPDTDELPSAGDVDVEAALAALDTVEVTEVGVDDRCGAASRFDATVPGEVVEGLVSALGDVEALEGPIDEAGGLGEVPDAVDVAVWLDGGTVACVGLDIGASALRADTADDAAIAEVRGVAHVVLRFSDDVTGVEVPSGATDLDLEEVVAGFFGAALEGLGGDLGDLGGFDDLTDVTDADTYGDDAELDALWDACAAGDDGACGELWLTSPFGSGYEAFGASCGERSDAGACGGGGVLDSGLVDDGDTYGDDAELDALWDACLGEDGQACDDLYWQSPLGSAYEAFGETCGGREEATAVGTCSEIYGSG